MNNGKMIFVTGSAMSGKSRFGVSQFKEMDRVQYLCTNEDMDDKTLNRIFYNERSKHFRWDIIRNFSVDKHPVKYKEYKCFVLDNLADWIYKKTISEYAARVEFTEQDMQSFVKELMKAITILMNEVTGSGGTIVVISAETGFQPAPFDVIDNIYREALCTVNQRVANMADEAYFSFSGLQLRVK